MSSSWLTLTQKELGVLRGIIINSNYADGHRLGHGTRFPALSARQRQNRDTICRSSESAPGDPGFHSVFPLLDRGADSEPRIWCALSARYLSVGLVVGGYSRHLDRHGTGIARCPPGP